MPRGPLGAGRAAGLVASDGCTRAGQTMWRLDGTAETEAVRPAYELLTFDLPDGRFVLGSAGPGWSTWEV
ncbi:hypothetical protein ACIRST_33535 [Kitasatospora sp. NPDC101447]|uniref:hypothetical protein n=1 Tax=Kitasatospora sp. NPDC101447 TaxID=3364102 RepID=UPI003815C120